MNLRLLAFSFFSFLCVLVYSLYRIVLDKRSMEFIFMVKKTHGNGILGNLPQKPPTLPIHLFIGDLYIGTPRACLLTISYKQTLTLVHLSAGA